MENLPSELLAHIAKFGGTRNYQEFEGSGWGTNSWKLRDLLYLRCASKACAEGVRVAVTDQQSTLDDACIAALVENLSLETLSIDENHTLTSEAVEIILRSPTAQTLSYGQFFRVDAFTSANILRLVRGCPKLIDLLWHLDCDRHVDGQNVEDLLALLKDRGKGNPDQYVEVDVL